MPLKYSDIDWNGEGVKWYITCSRTIDLDLMDQVEKPVIHEADDEVQKICEDFQDEVSRFIKKPIQNIEADCFAVKVVHSGLHFYIKASILTDEYVHLLVHRPFSYSDEKPKLEAAFGNQRKDKPLSYF